VQRETIDGAGAGALLFAITVDGFHGEHSVDGTSAPPTGR
jgi:hypothetical protein